MVGLNTKFSIPIVGKVSLLHAAIGAGVLYVGYNLLTKHKPFGSFQGEFAGGGGHAGGGGGGHAGGGGGGHVGGGAVGGGHVGGGEHGGIGGIHGGHEDREGEVRGRLEGLRRDHDFRIGGIWDGILGSPAPWIGGSYCPFPVPPGYPCTPGIAGIPAITPGYPAIGGGVIGGIGGYYPGYPEVDILRGGRRDIDIIGGRRDIDIDRRGGREGGREHGGGGHEGGGGGHKGGGGGHQGGGGGGHKGGGGGGHQGGGGGGSRGQHQSGKGGFGYDFSSMKFSGQAEMGYNQGLGEDYGDDYGSDSGGFGFRGGDHDFDDFHRGGWGRFEHPGGLGWGWFHPNYGWYDYPYGSPLGWPFAQPFGFWGGWGRGFRGFDTDDFGRHGWAHTSFEHGGHEGGGHHGFGYDEGFDE